MDEFSLAAERIERAALEDLHCAASPEVKRTLGLRSREVDGVFVSIAENEPSILLNRAIGLGVEQPATEDTVKKVLGLYGAAAVPRYFIQLHPEAEPSSIKEWLVHAGLVKYRGWVKFRRDPDPPPELKSQLEVRRIGPEHAEDFGRIVAPCFDLSDAAVPLLAALVGRPGWHIYLSFADGEPAGTGALFVKDDVAWFDWGSTHRDHRGRGGQGAVLCQRIRDAIDLGCQILATATGEEVPGDPQHSYKNITRTGFTPVYVRKNYVPER